MTKAKRRHRPRAAGRKPYRGPGAVESVRVDIGGVIVDRIAQGTDTSFFGDRPLETPAVPGAFEGLTALSRLFDGRVYIISKAGPKISAMSRDWLNHHHVFERSGVARNHLHFVRDRKDKAGLCRMFNITHFIDDRIEVLRHLDTVDHRYLFTGGLGEHRPPTTVPEGISIASTWSELLAQVRSDRTAGGGTP